MSMRTLYQTIRDTGDPDKIEQNGPILCNDKNAWMGDGYYFWDSSFDLAKHWGETHYNNQYMICSAKSEFRENEIFDLINNYSHIVEFEEAFDELQNIYPNIANRITVAFVIEYIKKVGKFAYKAIRACGINSFGSFSRRVFFPLKSCCFIELKPAWQVCVVDKSFLIEDSFKVIYPEEYATDYIV